MCSKRRVDEYARLITLEMGKPFAEAQAEVKKAASGARHFAEDGAAATSSRSPSRARRPRSSINRSDPYSA